MLWLVQRIKTLKTLQVSRITNLSSRLSAYGVLWLFLQSEGKQKYGVQQKGPWQQYVCEWDVVMCVIF